MYRQNYSMLKLSKAISTASIESIFTRNRSASRNLQFRTFSVDKFFTGVVALIKLRILSYTQESYREHSGNSLYNRSRRRILKKKKILTNHKYNGN